MEFQIGKFNLGRTVITPVAMETIHPEDVLRTMQRHAGGDWGDCCENDMPANNTALLDGSRLFSVYHDRSGNGFLDNHRGPTGHRPLFSYPMSTRELRLKTPPNLFPAFTSS